MKRILKDLFSFILWFWISLIFLAMARLRGKLCTKPIVNVYREEDLIIVGKTPSLSIPSLIPFDELLLA